MMSIMEVLLMITPNWQHHSNKDAKRTLKPQALRDAKRRTKALIKQLLSQSKRDELRTINRSRGTILL